VNFEPDSRTIVVQSFRRTELPAWIARCLESAKLWAKRWNYDYAFYGDEFYDLCGADYLARADGNPRTITNLARLEITRIKLWEGYDRVIWLDADVFVFDPARLTMQTDAGYAFSQQVWATAQPDGSARMDHASLHNAAFVFTRRQTDLELFIHIIRHTVKTRELSSSAQTGIWLISGLLNSLAIPVLKNVAMFSTDLTKAIAADNTIFLRDFARAHGGRMQAANLCLTAAEYISERTIMDAMDRLESSSGEILNVHLEH
jgi:hypothetical protein